MNVMVYPEIRCKHDGTRWWLEEPRKGVAWATEAERRPLEARVAFTQLVEPEKPTIPGGLWKRVDGYFKGERYNPAGITGYNYDNPNFSVDEAWKRVVDEYDPGQGKIMKKNVFCGPNNEGLDGGHEQQCSNSLPKHRTERVVLVELKPEAPTRAVREVTAATDTSEKGEG